MTRTSWGLDILVDEWRNQAACSPEVADWFWFASDKNQRKLSVENRAALNLCRSCPVLEQCLQHELRYPQPWARIAGGRVFTGRES